MNIYENIKDKLNESNNDLELKESLTGFEEYTEDDFGYSESNTKALSLLDSLAEYFNVVVKKTEAYPEIFQSNDSQVLKSIAVSLNKIKDDLHKAWTDE